MPRIIVATDRPELVDVLRRGMADVPTAEVFIDRRRPGHVRPGSTSAARERRERSIARALRDRGWAFVPDIAPGRDDDREPHARVLVLDDERRMREILRDVLSAAGYAVLTAGDGAAGVAIATQARPDLVLTDIFMPGTDGLDAIRALRRQPTVPKIIAMSAGWAAVGRRVRGSPDDYSVLDDARRLGADAVLAKPIHLHALLDTITQVLGRDG
ncbi:MAG TPA: response regulator [Terriglobales bacterium]|nr:response regulator [Terriglobales bacterium]